MNYKIAIVTPWFGKELKGGAEQLSWQIAQRFNKCSEIDVEVLTTCSKSFLENWFANYYDEGLDEEEKIKVRRFKVNTKQPIHFGRLNETIINHDLSKNYSPVSVHDENLFINENINSDNLVKYLKSNKDNYDAFIFLPFLYGVIVNSIEVVKEKVIIQPCLHDEGYAYLNHIRKNFLDSKRILFNSSGEFEIAKKIYGPSILSKSRIIGSGIELEEEKFDKIYNPLVEGDYLFFIGRRDKTKNTYYLIDVFTQYVRKTGKKIKLVLAGVGELPQNLDDCIVDLGLVSEEEKYNLISNCKAMINPSENESFSRIIYEAWFALKPVIVNKKCLATYLALKESGNSGWAFDSKENLFEIFDELLMLSKDELKSLSQKGKKYTQFITTWDNIISRYIDVFNEIKYENSNKSKKQSRKLLQFSAGFVNGDAISEQMYYIHTLALKNGWDSEIYSEHVSPEVRKSHNIKKFEKLNLKNNDTILYHHSIGSQASEFIIKAEAKHKYMIYHNITPSHFFDNYNKKLSKILAQGREELKSLVNLFDRSFGDSQYNVDELSDYGFKDSKVLPLLVGNEKWDYIPDDTFMKKLQDGRKNILFVGRISPNKCQQDLIKLYEYYQSIYGDCRLILAGGYDVNDKYYQEISSLINSSNYSENIFLTGHISYEQLFACFMTADIYISMSEHEGFGVPLVESMWFDLPVISYKSSAKPEVLGEAGLIFDDKSDLKSLSALVRIIFENRQGIKDKIIDAQRVRRENFTNLDETYTKMIFQ